MTASMKVLIIGVKPLGELCAAVGKKLDSAYDFECPTAHLVRKLLDRLYLIPSRDDSVKVNQDQFILLVGEGPLRPKRLPGFVVIVVRAKMASTVQLKSTAKAYAGPSHTCDSIN